MKGLVQNIENIAGKNVDFRQVLYTAKKCQLVVMALKHNEEIGAEVYKIDQFFSVEQGTGESVLNDAHMPIKAGFAVLIPAEKNNIISIDSALMKLNILNALPNCLDGVIHHTREDAEANNEHFDGVTAE